MRVYVVAYNLWPGVGIMGVCSGPDRAADLIDLLLTHPGSGYRREGFSVAEVPLDLVTIGGLEWHLGPPDGSLRIRSGRSCSSPG